MIDFFKRRKAKRYSTPASVFKSILDIPVGGYAVIRQHHSSGAVRQRLLDLGFIPGRKVKVVRVATLGCPLELRIQGYCVILRRTEARYIEVLE